jgi:2-deoxy-D-gluconate 3-dehydrogenase
MSVLEKISLEGKVAVVTGGSKGIGRAMALAFAERGADVVPTARTCEDVEAAAAEVEALGRRSLAVTTDVSDEASVQRLAARVLDRFGRVDILVNNAGRNLAGKGFVELTVEDWESVLSVNLRGPFLCTRELGRTMLEQGSGAVLNVSSILGTVGMTTTLPYSASKSALEGMTRTLAVEWAARGVRVNCIVPGFLETEMTAGLRQRPKLSAWLEQQIPLGRFGRADEMVGLALVLCSEAGSYITGATFYADGGWAAS